MDIQQAEAILDKLALLMNDKNGSDLIITSDNHPGIKLNGKVQYVEGIKPNAEAVDMMVRAKLSDAMYRQFNEDLEINFMIDYPGRAQFRTNVFKQKDTVGMVLRRIPIEIPTIESLNLPDYLKDLASLKRGLVLFTGGTGVGKSTSLASMIGYRNRNFSDHIITVEDPIEFVHQSKKSIVCQREIGIDTHSYARAMKSALRQAPDVLLVGEIRDMEVMEQAMTFAETGHLVFATLHATSAKLTLERIINLFPFERREKLLHDLSESLNAVVCQRLMHHASGSGRVAALEIMTNTPHIQMLISEGKLSAIEEAMDRASMREGVINFDNYILDLLKAEKVTAEEALLYVDSANNFKQKLREHGMNHLIDDAANSASTQSWSLEKSAEEIREEARRQEEAEKAQEGDALGGMGTFVRE
ncbi:PilT/PilU family type 4a pilus ATPase [Ostreibacterium oceani]|uniref:PilT/PilU family type 4a pilus ATPase n=1 Tax=Ostreibacterium oceani TaxID=2654998 RepID=A0A6N7F4P1_9GAMM|nr:PilT/PilU family type 4a pilus ATPase [Ostreibacterium oceani]MPV86856.1 PilT/PilU family type 4a pilus ATPase [Ostreibacterium oceani]